MAQLLLHAQEHAAEVDTEGPAAISPRRAQEAACPRRRRPALSAQSSWPYASTTACVIASTAAGAVTSASRASGLATGCLDGMRRFLRALAVRIGHRHPRSLLRKRRRGRAADTGATSGNQRHLAVEPHRAPTCSVRSALARGESG